MRDSCQIQNIDGSHRTYACRAECDRLVREGSLRRLPRAKGAAPRYQLVERPAPSNSRNSACEATLADIEKVAGLRRLRRDQEEADLERLIGLRLVPETARPTASGYLKRFTGLCPRPLPVAVATA